MIMSSFLLSLILFFFFVLLVSYFFYQTPSQHQSSLHLFVVLLLLLFLCSLRITIPPRRFIDNNNNNKQSCQYRIYTHTHTYNQIIDYCLSQIDTQFYFVFFYTENTYWNKCKFIVERVIDAFFFFLSFFLCWEIESWSDWVKLKWQYVQWNMINVVEKR